MIKRLLIIFIFILLQIYPFKTFSQEKKPYKNAFTFNLTRLTLLEARFGYERNISQRHVLRASAGLKFPIASESYKSFFLGGLYEIPSYYPVSKGAYFSLGYNYLVIPQKNIYVSAEIYYNHSYYDNKYYLYGTGSDSDSHITLQSMDLRKRGLKLLLGKKLSGKPNKQNHFKFDFFAGPGIQYRQEKTTVFKKKEGTSDLNNNTSVFIDYDPPQISNSNKWCPTFNAGILLSFLF
jgi:hypothetical protein